MLYRLFDIRVVALRSDTKITARLDSRNRSRRYNRISQRVGSLASDEVDQSEKFRMDIAESSLAYLFDLVGYNGGARNRRSCAHVATCITELNDFSLLQRKNEATNVR